MNLSFRTLIANTPRRGPFRRRSGFTIVEVVIAAAVVGGLMAATMTAVSAAVRARAVLAEQQYANTLASSLLDEACAQAYSPPIYAPGAAPLIVYDGGGFPVNRTAFDDVTDYVNYTETPPRARDGTIMTEFTGWTRSVLVERVLASDLSTVSGSDTGVRKITVTVQHGTRVIRKMSQIRTAVSDGARS